MSKTPAAAGTDMFNYTTELGSASVSVALTPGPCLISNRSVQLPNAAAGGNKMPEREANILPGTCKAGRCVCIPDDIQQGAKPIRFGVYVCVRGV
jgi:hypothetical protein